MKKRKFTYRHGVDQTPVSKLTIKQLMRSAAFVHGFNDARQGKPFDYDAYIGNTSKQWHYERGRLLGVLWDGPLKIGQKLTQSALYAAVNAFSCKEMI